MLRNGSFINPLRLKVPSLDPVPKAEMQAYRSHINRLASAMERIPDSESIEFVDFERLLYPDTTALAIASGR
jgi:hypothetical protein